jgi:hypothetical protein
MATITDAQTDYFERRLEWSKWREATDAYYAYNLNVYGNNLDLLKLEEKINIEYMAEQANKLADSDNTHKGE